MPATRGDRDTTSTTSSPYLHRKEDEFIIGAHRKSAAVTFVERATKFLILLALPEDKGSASVTDTVIEPVSGLPEMMCGSLTWEQGTEMARYQPYLTAIADEMNDRRQATLGFLMPGEAFDRVVVASKT